MRIVFAGTPEAALPSLNALADSAHDLVAVVTRPDAEQGRGRRRQRSPVAARAAELGLETLKPERPRDPEFLHRLRALAPDGVAAALDAVGTDEAVDTSLELVSDKARIVSIAAFGRGDTGITLISGDDPETHVRADAWRTLLPAAANGSLKISIARTYPLAEAAEALRERGATRVLACATHGIFAGSALEQIAESALEEVVVTNTIVPPPEAAAARIRPISVAAIFAEAIMRIHKDLSLSTLFT